MPRITLPGYLCSRCGHTWYTRKQSTPIVCPGCKSPYWDKEPLPVFGDVAVGKPAKPAKEPGDPRVQETMARLTKLRGYTSTIQGQERAAIKNMLRAGYSPEQIVGCHQALKADAWWANKPVTATDIAKRIGEWSVKKAATSVNGNGNYLPPRKPTAEIDYKVL